MKNQKTNTKATFGIYRSKTELNQAVSVLSKAGFGRDRVSMLLPDHVGDKDFPQTQKSEAIKYSKRGALAGIAMTSAAAFLVAIGVLGGADSMFGDVAALSVSFKVLLALGGVFIGLSFGAAAGAMIGVGTPKRAGRRHGRYVHAGGLLLSVRSFTNLETRQIENILERSGAQDISSTNEDRGWSDVFNERDRLEAHS